MADFVTVLRRAVANLEDNSEETRAALYGKARTALRTQLSAIDPPLPDEEVERQIAALDVAIVELEAEYGGSPAEAPDDDAETLDAAHPGSVALGASAGEAPRSPSHGGFRAAVAETESLGTATASAAESARTTLGAFDSDESAPEADASAASAMPDDTHDTDAGAAMAAAPPDDSPAPESGDDSYAEDYYEDTGGRSASIVVWAIVLAMIGGIAGAAYWQRDAMMEVVASFSSTVDEALEVADEPKTDERVPADGVADSARLDPSDGAETPAPSEDQIEPTPAAPEAQAAVPAPIDGDETERATQAMLVEEDAAGATSTMGGSVDWALLDDPEATDGTEKVIRATARFPDKGMTLALAIRRNTDPDLPASHTVDILFDLPPDFENGGISDVAGLVMKANPQSSGQPLVGAVVPVTDAFYLLGLSEGEYDRRRNLDELRRRGFIDIPVIYADETRAILSIAKGESGQQVFQEAFESWEQ